MTRGGRRLQPGLLQEQTGGTVVPGKGGKEHYSGRLDRLGPGEVNTLKALVSQTLAGPQVRLGETEGKKLASFSKAGMLLLRKAGMRKPMESAILAKITRTHVVGADIRKFRFCNDHASRCDSVASFFLPGTLPLLTFPASFLPLGCARFWRDLLFGKRPVRKEKYHGLHVQDLRGGGQ